MSERKVLNKYYPPDYDPSKIPKVRQEKNRQWNIRIMAPFNMRCNTCGEYIYKGKKFNSRKEDVEGEETYLNLKVFRFYIKCPRCVAEIAFRTDPQNTDYSLEGGATRNFEAMRTAEQLAQKQAQDKEDEEKNNPMKVLENRTKASQREMDMIETLEELRELNSRQAQPDHEQMIKLHTAYEEQLKKLQDEEDEKFVNSLFGLNGETTIKRLADDDDEDNGPPRKAVKPDKPTDILTGKTNITSCPTTTKTETEKRKTLWEAPSWQKSTGSLSSKSSLSGLVKQKQPVLVKPKTTVLVKAKITAPVARKQDNKAAATENKSHELESESKQESKPSALGLLGNYSDSDASSDSNT